MTEVRADTAASVFKVLVSPGERVAAGETLILLESMKMEIPVEASVAGTIDQLCVQEGTAVAEGDLIAVIV
jgi:acetyl-CoA carboxylase biotin carboxyl carrier protein